MVLVVRVRRVDVTQQLDLVQGLVEVVLVVLDDLEADQASSGGVQGLHRLREGRRPEEVGHLVAARYELVAARGEVLRVLEARAAAAVHDPEVEDLVARVDVRGVVLVHGVARLRV